MSATLDADAARDDARSAELQERGRTDALLALHRNLDCGVPDVEVRAATLLLGGTPAAAYSMSGQIANETDIPLKLISHGTDGHWKTPPPQSIAAQEKGQFKASFDGFEFEGKIAYVPANTQLGVFQLEWEIPLFGNNSISSKTTILGTTTSHEGGRGWNATAWWYLRAA